MARPAAADRRSRTGFPTLAIGLLVLGAAVVAVLGYQSLSSPATPISEVVGGGASAAAADGFLPDGVTVFDDRYAGIANLDRALLAALRSAAAEAAGHGVTVEVNSGWRSRAYQDQLLREAVAEYGSAAQAARWVATADTSPHVSGDAVDLGTTAAAWLSRRGAAYGLCPIYRNEPWHYELRPTAVARGCPAMYADPTYDPRMQP
jgi:zinc D-Ala-D-Ala carboxypeptidase